jgi:MFS family permease
MAYGRRDIVLIFAARITRLAAYGLLSVVLVLYLAPLGLSEARIGLLLALPLVGDAAASLRMSASADRAGRRRTVGAGANSAGEERTPIAHVFGAARCRTR